MELTIGVPDPARLEPGKKGEGVGRLLLLPAVGIGRLVGVVTVGLVDIVSDLVDALGDASLVVVLSCEFSGTDVTLDLTVTVEDGKILITGIVAVLSRTALLLLLLSINVNDRETKEGELEPELISEAVEVAEGLIDDVIEMAEELEIGVEVEEIDEDSVEIGVDESPSITDVDDCARDETVVVELVNLLTAHGCLGVSPYRILCEVSLP